MKEIELIWRTNLFPEWIIYFLFLSLLIFAILKTQKEYIFSNIRVAFVKPLNSVYLAKDEFRFFGKINLFFITSYFLVSWVTVTMVCLYFQIESNWLQFLPMLLYICQITLFFMIGIISGELKRMNDLIVLTNLTSYYLGLLFIPIVLIWYLNPQYSSQMINVGIVVFLGLQLYRIIRGVITSLRNKIFWYYIILYLCTFEIGGAYLLYVLISPYFIRS